MGQTQNSPEGLYISSGLGTTQDLPGEPGECCLGEGCLECPTELAAIMTDLG